MEHIEKLKILRACNEAIQYASGYDDPQKAWEECWRTEWMIWLYARSSQDEATRAANMARMAIAFARISLSFMNEAEDLKEAKGILDILDAWLTGGDGDLDVAFRRSSKLLGECNSRFVLSKDAVEGYFHQAAFEASNSVDEAVRAAREGSRSVWFSHVVWASESVADAAGANAAFENVADADKSSAARVDARRKHYALMADEIRKIVPVCPI